MTDSDARRVFDPKEWKILVDDQTASSAELVAEILGREGAEVVGGPTLGKHEVIELHEGSYGWIVCTVGRYLIETRQKL
jgi:C-terminal processing protease CtpA/Prc